MSHKSMNHIYRLIWSHVLNAWVAVAETARGRGKGASRKLMAAAALSLTTAFAQAAPVDGQVVSGAGSISQSGATTTILQSSQNLSLTWQSFNIAPQETVNFVQPSATAIAVNRIFDTNGTQILGSLNANGQVYLINPNGILFGQGAQVNVGALVASTLDFNDTSLSGSTRTFSGNGTGSIVNQGTINAANGGYVALLGNTVSNQGTITAPLGTVALGAGSAATLTFQNNSLVQMQVDQSVLNSLAENGGLIRADGGMVIMNAGAKNALLASVVNNTGVIEARMVENHEGVITLLGGMTAGTVNVGGTLDASAPNGGNGGFIETSAAHVKVADDAKITTAAPQGKAGTWLIDPVDFTIAAVDPGNGSSYMSNATLSTSLGSSNITIQTLSGGAGNGDIFVNDAVSWSAGYTLTLNAWRNINVNANISSANTSAGGVIFLFGQGAADGGSSVYTQANAASVTGFSQQWRKGSDANGLRYASVAGDLYLGNQFIEIGISQAEGGKLGAGENTYNKPSLFFGRQTTGSESGTGIGMLGDADGFGVGADLRIDYFLPGSPEERFTVGYDIGGVATSGYNFATQANGATYQLLGIGTDNAVGARVTTTLAGNLKVTQEFRLRSGQKHFTTDVVLENVGVSTLNNVTFIRSFDPDNTRDVNGTYETTQTIDRTLAAGDAENIVSATSTVGDPYDVLSGGKTAKIWYYSKSLGTSVGFGWDFWDGTAEQMTAQAATQLKGDTETDDHAMGILFKPGTLASMATAGFSMSTVLDNLSIDDTLASVAPTPILATPPEPVLKATSQIQSEFTVFNPFEQHQTLLMSPTIDNREANAYLQKVVTVDNKETRINIGGLGPILQILNGGVTLPGNRVNIDEKDKK